jgi:hypothetical protein
MQSEDRAERAGYPLVKIEETTDRNLAALASRRPRPFREMLRSGNVATPFSSRAVVVPINFGFPPDSAGAAMRSVTRVPSAAVVGFPNASTARTHTRDDPLTKVGWLENRNEAACAGRIVT